MNARSSDVRPRILRLRTLCRSEFTQGEPIRDLKVHQRPIREVLPLLRQCGVEAIALPGDVITPGTVKDARDLMGLRILLEGEAASSAAARGTDLARLKELEELCRASYNPNDHRSVTKFLADNFDFHMAIATLSGNARLIDALRQVIQQLEWVMHHGLTATTRSDEIVHEHAELVAAILSGNAAKAREIAVLQGHTSQRMVLEALLSSEDVISNNITALHEGSRRSRSSQDKK